MKLKRKTRRRLRILLPIAGFAAAVTLLVCIFGGYGIFDRSGWSTAKDGSLRYLDQTGRPLEGWQEIEGATHYFSPNHNGAMAVGLFEIDGTQFFFDESGISSTGWITHNDHRYYFNEDGTMHTGWLNTDSGRYYFAEDGVMQTGWLETPEGLCYLSETGAVTSGWVDTDKGRCYIGDDGSIHTGWLEKDGRTYYMTEDGPIHTGWLDLEGDRYYFHQDGTMAVGTVIIDGVARHFASTGKYFVMVNPWNSVPADYESDLVYIEGFWVDKACYDDLLSMLADCRAAGNTCNISSAYRGFDYQTTLFETKVKKLMNQGYSRAAAEAETGRSIAIPGTSEHQLGLAVDLKNRDNTYNWLAKNSWKYGFIVRYPTGSTELTGIYYEPWHVRYVGKELAKELYDLDLCVEAYLNELTEAASKQAA